MQLTAMQGILAVIASAAMWGISGVIGQFIFQNYHIDMIWLMIVRQLTAGLIFLGVVAYKEGNIFAIWKNKRNVKELLVFSLIGLLGAQYGFYYTINQSNAATATILQYEAPIFVIMWESIKNRRLPSRKEIMGIILALAGVFLISTHGRPDQLVISSQALIVGILSAVALAVYTVCPVHILKDYSTATVIGWGQLLAAMALFPLLKGFSSGCSWDMASVAGVSYIVIFGTVIPFGLFLMGMKVIGATKASLISCFEPLCSILCVVLVLGTHLAGLDIMGMFCIISTVLMLSVPDGAFAAIENRMSVLALHLMHMRFRRRKVKVSVR